MSSEPPSDLAREREVFALLAEVCELDPDARERALAACGDPALAREVRWKLAASESLAGLLEAPAPFESTYRPIQAGDVVGPFEIRAPLGEGGMGLVFRAVQRQPVTREVALKIVRLGRLHGEAGIRFAAERQAMARLEHPNIGRILEAGTTDDGLPYFAMELIDGPPITVYCDRAALSIEQRLRLFLDVCRGTHHAHLKLLLHRDLKPSNVLVPEVDGRPLPKIIDFGIAKGLNAPLVTAAAATGDRFLGTPAYMSPEALEPGRELDVRSDVFALGILLYELLTGNLPWAAPDSDPVQLVKQRLERDAERPSTQITGLDAERRDRIARRRRLDVDRLAKRLRGDLDSIVMKAIEPEPGRRYDSAAELADDIERHLANEPIRARPLTTRVLLGKLLRRHRLPVIAAATVALALVIGSIGTVGGLLRARQAERVAVAAEVKAVAEASAAVEARDEADEVADFLVGIFAAANSQALDADKPPGEISALELLARGAERIETDLADRPVVRARLEETIGFLYVNLGEFDRALELHRASVATLEAVDDPPPFQLARSYLNLAQVEQRVADRAAATRHLDEAFARLETLPDDEARRLRAQALDLAGRLRLAAGDYAGAEEALLETIAAYTQLGDDFAPAIANVRHSLGALYLATGRFAEAEAEFRQAIEIYQPLVGAGHPRLADFSMGVAGAVASQGRLEEAAGLFEGAERDLRLRRGPDHHTRAMALYNLGLLNRDLERFDRAEAYQREALAIRERALGSGHPIVAASLSALARALCDLGRDNEARPLQERALAIRESTLGAEHLDIADSLGHLATLATRRGDHELAHRHARRAYDIQAAKLDPGHRDVGRAAALLGETLWHLGRRDEARQRFDEARALFEAGGESMQEDRDELEERLARLGAS
jgi:serine/threonine protein kinase/Flp pilus assembly protein TadD